MLRRIVAVSLFAISSLACADTLDVSLSNSVAQFKIAKTSGLAGKSDLFASVMYNDVNSVLGEAGLLVVNEESRAPGLSIGVGAKAVGGTLNKLVINNTVVNRTMVSAVALGAQLRYEVPADRRFAFAGEYHYAPKIICFGDTERYTQAAVRAEFAISPLVQAYVGYRSTTFFIVNTNERGVLDNGVHLGVRLSF